MSTALDLKNIYLRQATFRFELLDSSGNYIGDLGIEGSSTPSISHDTSRAIFRTVSSIVLDPKISGDVNPFSDRVRPVMDLGGKVSPLGVFLFGSSSLVRRTVGPIRTSALVDQTFIVDQPIESAITLAPGTLLTVGISMILSQVGGFEFYIESNPTVVGAAPISWRAGTSSLQIVNDLCTALGYYPFHFNNVGIGQVRPAVDGGAASPTITYSNAIFDESLVESDNLLEVPNRYIVVDTAAILEPIVGVYDVPSTLPHSFDHRGFYLRETIEVQGLESSLQANLIAAAAAQRDSRQGQASFLGPPNPQHDTFDLLWVDGRKYLEIGWTLPLIDGGEMDHSLLQVNV